MLATTNTKLPSHAGLLCFNHCGQILLVSAIGNNKCWLFPKGHIEKGETAATAAVREALEEAGIVATALSKIGNTSFIHNTEDVSVEWWSGFAIRKIRHELVEDYAETDFRESKWVNVDEALELLSFDDLKVMLRRAVCWET